MAVPITRDPPRCAEQPNAIFQPAVASTVTQIGSAGSGRLKSKK